MEFLNKIQKLSETDLINKLKALAAIDDIRDDYHYYNSKFSETQDLYLKRILASDDYVEFALLSLDEIISYAASGEGDESQHQKSWNDDSDLIDAIDESEAGIAKTNFRKEEKTSDPSDLIKVYEPYLLEILKVGKLIHIKNTSQLQIGYEINKLTTALAKISSWEKVIHWSELFFNLDENYRNSSPKGEQEKILARLNKAKEKVAKD